MAEKKSTLSPDLSTSILQLFLIPVNVKLAETKLTFSPELFTSILQEHFKLVNGKLAQKKWTLYPIRLLVYCEFV